jgi:hypothetical protein
MGLISDRIVYNNSVRLFKLGVELLGGLVSVLWSVGLQHEIIGSKVQSQNLHN